MPKTLRVILLAMSVSVAAYAGETGNGSPAVAAPAAETGNGSPAAAVQPA